MKHKRLSKREASHAKRHGWYIAKAKVLFDPFYGENCISFTVKGKSTSGGYLAISDYFDNAECATQKDALYIARYIAAQW